jgi:anaphase-promoting complex subunit 10
MERELGVDAVISISSAKPGNGVEQIRDDSLDTYWQSDGTAPHLININFMEKKTISHLCFYCDYGLDESYTVKKACIRSGSTVHDLVDISVLELNEPVGWVVVSLTDPRDKALPLRTHVLQLKILSMHQNGRDTHIRQIKVMGPRSSPQVMGDLKLDRFKTVETLQYSQIR